MCFSSLVHPALHLQVLNHFISGDKAMVYMRLQNVKAIVADATAIFSTLHHALPKRKFAPQKHDQKSRAGEEECFLPSSTPELLKSSTDDGVCFARCFEREVHLIAYSSILLWVINRTISNT